MTEDRSYKITVWLDASDEPDVRAPAYVAMTRSLAERFAEAFSARATRIVVNPPPLFVPENQWVGAIDAETADKGLIWDVYDWVAGTVRPRLPKSNTNVSAPADGPSVAHARWVKLESDWYNVERGAEYDSPPNAHPMLCSTCGWPDLDRAPEPFLVDRTLSKAGKNDLLGASNGAFVVSKRVRDILTSLAGGDLETGPIEVRGKKSAGAAVPDFFWVRPTRRIGSYVQQTREGPTCAACGRPQRFATYVTALHQPRGPIVENFGGPGANLALVGEFPTAAYRDSLSSEGAFHDAVISGGLFAVLWNESVKGLRWPVAGPFVSRLANENSWEVSRRFGDRTSPARDRILKRKGA